MVTKKHKFKKYTKNERDALGLDKWPENIYPEVRIKEPIDDSTKLTEQPDCVELNFEEE